MADLRDSVSAFQRRLFLLYYTYRTIFTPLLLSDELWIDVNPAALLPRSENYFQYTPLPSPPRTGSQTSFSRDLQGIRLPSETLTQSHKNFKKLISITDATNSLVGEKNLASLEVRKHNIDLCLSVRHLMLLITLQMENGKLVCWSV